MSFFNILTEPAIILITTTFLCFIFLTLSSYSRVGKNLQSVYSFLKSLEKKEISYRFNQLNDLMSSNSFTSTVWEDFKKALIFPDKLYLASHSSNNSDVNSDIYLTIDASYFFNEETLVSSNINYKFIQTMPTLLTGLGPFFTFLKMAIAFAALNLTNDTNVTESLNNLMGNIQIAALCSVFAVGFSLTFMFVEKIMYNKLCKKYYLAIQKEFVRLFDIVTSEKFLVDLVKESKNQNSTNEKTLKALPENIAKAVTAGINETTTPYLENILYSLNKINESLGKENGGDVVDKLF